MLQRDWNCSGTISYGITATDVVQFLWHFWRGNRHRANGQCDQNSNLPSRITLPRLDGV